jgi:acyl-CoA thioester hydrolase
VNEPDFTHRHRVRYHEADGQQIVFNSRYLEYFDVAMTEYFRSLGWNYPDMVAAGCDPSLVTTTVDFHKPARFDEELDVGVRLERVGSTSFTLAFEVLRVADGALIASATTVYVNFDPRTERTRPIPDAVRERMTSHEPEELVADGNH